MTEFPKLARIKQDDENMEKIHCAARRGQTELVRRLISMGIPATIQNKFGCTALHLACKHGQIGPVKELAPLSDLSQTWHGQKPLHLAVLSGKEDVVRALVDAAKEQGKTVESFLNECDDYEVEEIGQYPKHVAGQTALHWCVGLNMIPMMKTLLALGASPTAKDRSGETVIMRAIELNAEEAFDILLKSSPTLRLDICDKAGRSSLHWAIRANRPAMAARLFDAGHEVNIEDEAKVTPFLLAAYAAMPQLLERLLETADQFMLQNATFHNGVHVLPERIEWLPFVTDEAAKAEVVKTLQKKLDSITKGAGGLGSTINTQLSTTTRDTKKTAPLTLAPSAPVKPVK